MTEHLHYVTVTPGAKDDDPDGSREPARIHFECRGDNTSKCHQYPDCDCEVWGDDHDHPFVAHDDCWMKDWFEADGAVYDGDDSDDMEDNSVPRDMDREGYITTSWEDDYVSWEWAE